MTERLLQFIWQLQYFNKTDLCSSQDAAIQVITPGQLNRNQGPDFLEAVISIGNTIWAGSVELHLKTSDWIKHGHQEDPNYKNVILHVVWQHDRTINSVEVLELQPRVSKLLLNRYEALMNSTSFIPCDQLIHRVKSITWKNWKDRLLAERLERKSDMIKSYLEENQYHWEETCWWLMARAFGMKINADAFEAVARTLPVTLLAKHKQQLIQLEALLLGQAGLLADDFKEHYPVLLQKEYHFYQKKYQLTPVNHPVYFLRMRPENFPSLRLAQLAVLIHQSTHLFSRIKDAVTLAEVKNLFTVTANDYWHYHYKTDEVTGFRKKTTGKGMIENILINTVIPLLFTYGRYYREEQYKHKACNWLEQLAAEKNSITKGFVLLGIENKHAFDSQGLIELKNEYCNKKNCLTCAVGNAILKSA